MPKYVKGFQEETGKIGIDVKILTSSQPFLRVEGLETATTEEIVLEYWLREVNFEVLLMLNSK